MSTDETNQHASNAVRDFFKDARVAETVLDLAVRKKPVGWSKRSNAPYYTEFHGRQMKSIADTMMKSSEDQMFFYHDYQKVSKTTLYLRVNQSLRALADFCDNESKDYLHWSQMVRITREKTGVRISIKPEFKPENGDTFVPRAVGDRSQEPEWQLKIDEYLNSNVTRPLLIDKLMLSPKEISDVKASLATIKTIMCSVKSSEIRIVKTS